MPGARTMCGVAAGVAGPSGFFETVKVAGVFTSIVGLGFGAYRSIRGDLAEAEGRLRSDFRSEIGAMEGRLRETTRDQHRECLERIEAAHRDRQADLAELRRLIEARPAP